MTSFFKKITNLTMSTPNRIFLIDGFGAFISTVLLGYFFFQNHHMLGIPATILSVLASIAGLVFIYDLCNILKKSNNVHITLKVLALFNYSYSLISLLLSFYYYETITNLGLIYISVEIISICFLATIELIISNKIKPTYSDE